MCFWESDDVERVVSDFRLQSFLDAIKEITNKLNEEGQSAIEYIFSIKISANMHITHLAFCAVLYMFKYVLL